MGNRIGTTVEPVLVAAGERAAVSAELLCVGRTTRHRKTTSRTAATHNGE